MLLTRWPNLRWVCYLVTGLFKSMKCVTVAKHFLLLCNSEVTIDHRQTICKPTQARTAQTRVCRGLDICKIKPLDENERCLSLHKSPKWISVLVILSPRLGIVSNCIWSQRIKLWGIWKEGGPYAIPQSLGQSCRLKGHKTSKSSDETMFNAHIKRRGDIGLFWFTSFR